MSNSSEPTESGQPSGRATLGLTGLTMNAMALIAPGAFLWLTFQIQALYGAPMAGSTMWFGICLLYTSPRQLVAQVIGVVTNAVTIFGLAYLFFRVVERAMGNRVLAEVESGGLDDLEMGSDAYPRD